MQRMFFYNARVEHKKSEHRFYSVFAFLVEYSGLEPLTSTLPVSRSSQMS